MLTAVAVFCRLALAQSTLNRSIELRQDKYIPFKYDAGCIESSMSTMTFYPFECHPRPLPIQRSCTHNERKLHQLPINSLKV